MASGITLVMRALRREKPVEPFEKKDRDRSLRGKARVRARKAARR